MVPFHLPQEIITELIQRLPLRSVLRCKLMSKQWKNLINDPKFYTLHKDTFRTTFFHGKDGLYCGSISDGHGLNIPPFTDHRVLSCRDDPHLIGSSHGIACLKELNGPWFTGSLQTVAKSEQSDCSYADCYGFGYDYYGDDYKIFVGCDCDCCPCWIYSFRNKEWNSFQGFPSEVYTYSFLVAHSFNGVLHWAVAVRSLAGDKLKGTIVTYDLHTNRFGEIQVPPSVSTHATISEVDGQLCYVCKLDDMWVMKEYGVDDSWERFAIQCHHSPIPVRRWWWLKSNVAFSQVWQGVHLLQY